MIATSEAMPSARRNPVVRMTAPAMVVKMNAARSVRMLEGTSMFIDWRLALDSV